MSNRGFLKGLFFGGNLFWALALLLVCLGGVKLVAAEPDASLKFTDLAGGVRQPFHFNDEKAAVFFFVWHTCPVANAYAPEIERIFREYQEKHIPSYLVEVDPDLTDEKARKHVTDYRLTLPVFVDREHRLAGVLEATHSPEAIVVSASGDVVYRGRIDDRQMDYGKRRAVASKTDLRDTLDAILAGESPAYRETRVVGCYLPEVD